MLTVGSLFSGIGGLDLGLERAGMRVVWQCEADAFCRRVLAKHWPGVPCYHDVRDVDERAPRVDLVCGGFPCQPVSTAGRRLGQADERWLWPEFARVIRVLRPQFVFLENTPGLLSLGFGDVLGDLAAIGYDAEWQCVPAAALGALHRRDRVWIVAYPVSTGRRIQSVFRSEREGSSRFGNDGKEESVAYANGERQQQPCGTQRQKRGRPSDCGWWTTEPDVGRVAHGIPARMDRLRGLGNAVVPQVAEWIGRRIMKSVEPQAGLEGGESKGGDAS